LGTTTTRKPAIRAWSDLDPSVVITEVHVPGDGLVLVGVKYWQLGPELWHYEYAVQNVNSDRSIGAFTIPFNSNLLAQNVGFHSVAYHSGEPYGSAPWQFTQTGNGISWATDSFVISPNANALRWATLYNFWFDVALA